MHFAAAAAAATVRGPRRVDLGELRAALDRALELVFFVVFFFVVTFEVGFAVGAFFATVFFLLTAAFFRVTVFFVFFVDFRAPGFFRTEDFFVFDFAARPLLVRADFAAVFLTTFFFEAVFFVVRFLATA